MLRALLALSLCASVAHADGLLRRGHTPLVPSATPKPKATICIDREFIRRVIREHLAAITRCYERELRRAPRLSGTVQTTFLVLRDGRAVDATANGMTPSLDACVARALEAIRFPPIAGGGTVFVSYPFTFSPPRS